MIKYLVISFFFLGFICPYNSAAKLKGQAKIDSMLAALLKLKEDTNKTALLYELVNEHVQAKPEEAMKYAKAELELAKKLGIKNEVAIANMTLGRVYNRMSDPEQSLKYYKLALKDFEELGDELNISRCSANMGNVYDAKGSYAQALECDLRALKLAEKLGKKNAIMIDLKNIAIIYREMKQPDKALEYDFKALKIVDEIGDSNSIASLLCNIGNIYHDKKEDSTAIIYHRKAISIINALGDSLEMARPFSNMGSTYIEMRKYDSAIKYASMAVALYEIADYDHGIALATGTIGEIYQTVAKHGEYLSTIHISSVDQALQLSLQYYSKAKAIFRKEGDLEDLITAAKSLAEINEMLHNYKEAMDNLKEYNSVKDSLYAEQNTEKIASLETERALLVKDKQIAEDQRKSKERLFFISITALLAIIIVIVVRNFYKQRKLTTQKATLANQKEVLLQEKDVLIKEIHHRVKNNLQVVVSLLDLQTGNTEDEIARKTMTESAARVKSISLIHRFLYQNEDVTGIEYNNFVRELFTQVIAVFKRHGQNVVLQANVPETVLDIDTAVPMGLIINELLINSFKYAFPDADGSVRISLQHQGELYQLSYMDSGKGLPAGYDIKKATTTGMTIMRSLAKQVGGSITYTAEDNTFIVVFKDILGRKKTL